MWFALCVKGARMQTRTQIKERVQTDMYMEQHGANQKCLRNVNTIGGTIA